MEALIIKDMEFTLFFVLITREVWTPICVLEGTKEYTDSMRREFNSIEKVNKMSVKYIPPVRCSHIAENWSMKLQIKLTHYEMGKVRNRVVLINATVFMRI